MLKVKLIAHTPDPEKIIAAAARFCYSPADTDTIMEKLTDDATGNFINMLMEAIMEPDPAEKQTKLKEILGHTPLEVMAGAVLGIVTAIISFTYLK